MPIPDSTELILRDIHLPASIGWWPPAVGWWLLVLLIPALIYAAYRGFKYLTRKTAIKTGRQQIVSIQNNTELTDMEKLQQLSMLLRRIAISHYSRQETAGLTGMQWLQFLEQNLQGQPFSEGAGRQLLNIPYRQSQDSKLDMESLFNLSFTWLNSLKRRHP